MNVHTLPHYILAPSNFLTEHAIKHNNKPTATHPLAVIADAEKHSLPPFTFLALVPSPPPSKNQWERYISFLEERVLSSERENNANACVDLPFALGWHVIQTESQTEEGSGGAGYWVIVWLGPSLNVPKLLPLRRSLRRRRARRKIGRNTREMDRRARAHLMASMLLRA